MSAPQARPLPPEPAGMQKPADGPVGGARRTILLLSLAAILFAGFAALGTWQVQRMFWKHELIARVTQRVHAPAVDAPGPQDWASVTAQADEYRHVRLQGRFLHERATLVQAVTDLGGGFWLLTPLRRADGSIVLVNRGFMPSRTDAPASPSTVDVTVTGLLRMTEPGGGFLRKNDAAGERWYSRDVQAIAASRGLAALGPVAPYFVDADADPAAGSAAPKAAAAQPVGGLTVISFPDNHLAYALTWYALALMVAGVTVWLLRGKAGRGDRPERY